MHVNFQVRSLTSSEFEDYFKLSKEALKANEAALVIANAKPGFPCRVSLQEAEIGEEVLLINYRHHQAPSAYAASGPIFVRKGVSTAQMTENELPPILAHRQLSIRAYGHGGHMMKSRVVSGKQLRKVILQLFEDNKVTYLQVHNAGPGCFNCQIDRVV